MGAALPRVAIIIHAYNQAEFLPECLRAASSQSYPNIELVVVDDCSSDQSKAIIEAFEDFPLKRFFNAQNLGLCKSFNRVIDLIDCDYFIDLAADDVLLPNYVKKCIEKWQTCGPETGSVYTHYHVIDHDGNIAGQITNAGEDYFQSFLLTKKFLFNTHLISKSAFIDIGKYSEDLTFEDHDFHLRFSEKYHYACVPEKLFCYRFHTHSYTKTYSQKARLFSAYPTMYRRFFAHFPIRKDLMTARLKQLAFKAYCYECTEAYGQLVDLHNEISNQKIKKWPIIKNFGLIFGLWKLKMFLKTWTYRIKNGRRNYRNI